MLRGLVFVAQTACFWLFSWFELLSLNIICYDFVVFYSVTLMYVVHVARFFIVSEHLTVVITLCLLLLGGPVSLFSRYLAHFIMRSCLRSRASGDHWDTHLLH